MRGRASYFCIASFPTSPEGSAVPTLHECSTHCWGDPWQQRSSNQPLSLSYTHPDTHTDTRTFNLYTLSVNVVGMHRGRNTLSGSRWDISASRWPAGSPKAAPQHQSADQTRNSECRIQHFNGQDGWSRGIWSLKIPKSTPRWTGIRNRVKKWRQFVYQS